MQNCETERVRRLRQEIDAGWKIFSVSAEWSWGRWSRAQMLHSSALQLKGDKWLIAVSKGQTKCHKLQKAPKMCFSFFSPYNYLTSRLNLTGNPLGFVRNAPVVKNADVAETQKEVHVHLASCLLTRHPQTLHCSLKT